MEKFWARFSVFLVLSLSALSAFTYIVGVLPAAFCALHQPLDESMLDPIQSYTQHVYNTHTQKKKHKERKLYFLSGWMHIWN